MTPEQYAQAVRDALADHPEREELLEDLDDHLAEIAAESDLPLEHRLGPPAVYAEELAAAYGDRPERGRRRRPDPREWALRAHTRLLHQGSYRSFAHFLPELRPGWWVLRGYLLAMLLLSVADEGRIVPSNIADLAVVAAGIWVSVWFGRRRGRGLASVLTAGVNVLAVLALFAGMVAADSLGSSDSGTIAMAQRPVWVDQVGSDDVYNIKPYAKDGTPLTDVYLYDQDGNPITTHPEIFGYRVDESCGQPILNRYPLPLVRDGLPDDPRTAPEPAPTCAAPSASAAPAATVTPTPAPAATAVPEPKKTR
ncbi:hypothetical protein GCM10022419_069520 [Nonomuraea rosea]|uniref:Uncharacterized protein n=1 Tax=Nonomuraea rosea TaxID=638574 RepID=A0ABP6Y7K7_9ACTN